MHSDKRQILRTLDEMRTSQERLEKSHENFRVAAFKMASLFESLHKQVKQTAELAQRGSSTNQLMQATCQMQEMNTSFNLQYLQLQQKMQGDNRKFTTISNVMKTKHDTSRNAINNIR